MRIPRNIIALGVIILLVISVFVFVDRRPSVDIKTTFDELVGQENGGMPPDGGGEDGTPPPNGGGDGGAQPPPAEVTLGRLNAALEIQFTDGSKELMTDVFQLGAVSYDNRNVAFFVYQAWFTPAMDIQIASDTFLALKTPTKTWRFTNQFGPVVLGPPGEETRIMFSMISADEVEAALGEGTFTMEWVLALSLSMTVQDIPIERRFEISYPVLEVDIVTPEVTPPPIRPSGGFLWNIDAIRRSLNVEPLQEPLR
jgi:hypothetical protein